MGWNYSSIPKHFNGCSYLFILGLELIHIRKRGHRITIRRLINIISVHDDIFRTTLINPMAAETRILLTHWGRVTHICVGKLTIIGSNNGLSPGRRQAIIWTSAGILLSGPLGTNFSEILIEIQTFSLKEIRLKMSSAKWCPFCLGLNVLIWLGHHHDQWTDALASGNAKNQ